MTFTQWLSVGSRHRTVLILSALLSTFAGVDLLLNPPKGAGLEWFSIPFLVAGGALFMWAVWPRGISTAPARGSLAGRLIHFFSWRGRLVPYFPMIGIGIVIADLAYNLALSATPALLTEDTIVLAAAGALIGYGLVPRRFARERDFMLVFFAMLNAILVVPLLAARAFYADLERSVDGYSWVALAPQTSAVLSLLGVGNTVHSVSGSTAPGLTFTPRNLGIQVTVVITTACSGIYSFGIFASAFIAFTLAEYERPSIRIWMLLCIGLVTAYVANVLRMVVIVLVGYHSDTVQTDLQNMLAAHSHAGWLIFLGFLALFWGLVFKTLPSNRLSARRKGLSDSIARITAACAICQLPLTPTIPAVRCSCGAYQHATCLAQSGRCQGCGKKHDLAMRVGS